MKTFGFKIVERDRGEIEPVVRQALALDCPLEVGLYFGEAQALSLLRECLPGSSLPIMAHLDHRRLSLYGLEANGEALCAQLELAAGLGARYVITHVSSYPMTPRPERQGEVLERLMTGLAFATERCRGIGLALHIENTYHGLDFYRRFFQETAAVGLGATHFCFDLGHAKIWSTEGLQDWLGFLTELDLEGRRIHCHLHANAGLNDDHLSFLAAERKGLTGADGFTGAWDDYQALNALAMALPAAFKVFEVPPAEAVENRAHVLARLAAARSAGAPPGA
ncbi:hypothetical protein CCR95_08990 [Thiocystis minor]|uniref:TIM barrel protein n=1 Tax=Thiocystis minor TaxID=61597 RepID=UPI001911E29A|nr:TIM barrel protein [Thiocystis minor]MBK5964216.1 hypothetical protein [Thiocystis minor]